MAKAAFEKIRAGMVKLQEKLGVSITLYGVGSASSYSSGTGVATLSGGTDVTLTAVVHSADERSVSAGLAQAGDLIAVVPEADLSESAGDESRPHRGGRVLANGKEYTIEKIDSLFDDSGVPTHFTLTLRS